MRQGFLVFIILAGMLIASTTFASEEVPKFLGAGAVIMTRPYHGTGATVMPVPLVSMDYKGFYIRGIEAGYTFYDGGGFKLSAIASPRFMGYSSQDSTALNGMEDRRQSLDAGLKIQYELPFAKSLSLNAQILNDVLSRYDGREGSFSLEQARYSKYFHFFAAAGIKALSSQMTDYYYGIRGDEAAAGRPAYTPGYAVDPFIGLTIKTGFSERLLVAARVGVEWLDSTIRQSPIVEDSYTVMGMLGIVRRF